jgi:hypothetical protein
MLGIGRSALVCFMIAGCGGTTSTVTAPPERQLIVGIGDQDPGFFSKPLFARLAIKHARLIASYDTVDVSFDRDLADAWLAAAEKAGIEPFVAFGHSRRAGRQHHLPSVSEYRRAFRAFRERYPQVRLYAAWNEPNNQSQPTDKNPKRAAQFTNALKEECPDCTVIAGDVLDEPDAPAWLTTYSRFLNAKPVAWGIHDYSATNRFEPRRLTDVMAVVEGDVWLTETGGVAKFGRAFPYDLQRQAKATRYVFTLARRHRRITRVYLYNWTGAPRSARFDAGLTNPDGSPRPAYEIVRQEWSRRERRSTDSPSR